MNIHEEADDCVHRDCGGHVSEDRVEQSVDAPAVVLMMQMCIPQLCLVAVCE